MRSRIDTEDGYIAGYTIELGGEIPPIRLDPNSQSYIDQSAFHPYAAVPSFVKRREYADELKRSFGQWTHFNHYV